MRENVDGTVVNEDELMEVKRMVVQLAGTVNAIVVRVGASSKQLAEASALTEKIDSQERCLKRERDCPPAKRGVVQTINLLDQVASKVQHAVDVVKGVSVLVPVDGEYTDASLPTLMAAKSLVETEKGAAMLASFVAIEELLSSRLLELGVVRAASTNRIGWATVESLSSPSWRDLCSTDKQAVAVKNALAEQEKLAATAKPGCLGGVVGVALWEEDVVGTAQCFDTCSDEDTSDSECDEDEELWFMPKVYVSEDDDE